MIIIEGPRNVGKTYLVDSLEEKYTKYKFSFGDYYKDYGLSDKKSGMAFAIGKDLQVLNLCKNKIIPRDVIMDRGFISTIVYSILEGRCTMEWAEEYFYRLMKEFGDYIGILFLYGKNPEKRSPKDGWLKIKEGSDMKLFEYFFNKTECYFKEYENNFTSIDTDLFELEIDLIIEEMKRV